MKALTDAEYEQLFIRTAGKERKAYQRALLAALEPTFSGAAMKPKLADDCFIRKTPLGYDRLTFPVATFGDSFQVTAVATLRASAVEDQWHRVSGTQPKFQALSATLWLIMPRVHVRDRADFEAYCGQVRDEFLPRAQRELFTPYTSLVDVDRALNSSHELEVPLGGNAVNRFERGLIVGWLVGGKPRLEALAEIYRPLFAQFDPVISARLEALIVHLRSA